MVYNLIQTNVYKKRYIKFLKKYQYMKKKLSKVTTQLENDPDVTWLENHNLKGKLKKYSTSKINDGFRIGYERRGKNIILLALGTHAEVYNKQLKEDIIDE